MGSTWWARVVVLLLAILGIANYGSAQNDAAESFSPVADPDDKFKETSSLGIELGSLPAANLTALCFVGEGEPNLNSSSIQLERIDDPSTNVDIQTLARYTLTNIFLNPSQSSWPTNVTLVVPLRDEILACAPDVQAAVASLEVLSACQATAQDLQGEAEADDVVFLVFWEATLTCTNRVGVTLGSTLDLVIGSVLSVSSSSPIQVNKLFVSARQ